MPQSCDMGQTALTSVDFFTRKIRQFQPGSNPRSWVPEAGMLTTRPPKLCLWVSLAAVSKTPSAFILVGLLGKELTLGVGHSSLLGCDGLYCTWVSSYRRFEDTYCPHSCGSVGQRIDTRRWTFQSSGMWCYVLYLSEFIPTFRRHLVRSFLWVCWTKNWH
jgi:hypothetical protein